MWRLFQIFSLNFGFYACFDLFLNGYDYERVDCVSLMDGFSQLQDDSSLRLVVEGKDKPTLDIFVVDVVVECGSMESKVLLEKVNGVFASRNH